MTARLVLHPGFEKCATTALQWRFFHADCALARALDVIWLGEGFKPYNGLPPVMEIGLAPKETVARIASMPLQDEATYFLSAESLVNDKSVQKALADRFEVSRIVLTIRFPPLLELSDYAFRGWLTHSVEKLLIARHGTIAHRFDLCRKAITGLKKTFDQEVHLCPIDLPDLEERFLHSAFGRLPERFAALMKATPERNASASLALAATMHEVLQETSADLTPTGKQQLIRAMQADPGPARFDDWLPQSVLDYLADRRTLERSIQSYNRILKGSISDDQIRALDDIVRDRAIALSQKTPIGPAEAQALRAHASALLAKAQTVA